MWYLQLVALNLSVYYERLSKWQVCRLFPSRVQID